MRRFGLWVLGTLIVSSAGCGGQAADRQPAPPSDTTVAAAPESPPEAPAEVNQLPQTNVEAAESGEEYVVHGVCPFNCCTYGGNWTMLEGGALRSAPSHTADSVGSVAPGASVHTDEGVMVLHPPGIAVIVPDSATRTLSGAAVGDTVQVISYTGAKVARVRSNGQESEVSWSGLRMLREPLQRWWVHMTDPITGQGGWLQVNGVGAPDVGAPNSCKDK